MPTEGNIFYYGSRERDGRTIHIVRVDERSFEVVASSIDEAIKIAQQANLN
jgi:hypothetical protein